MEKKTDSDRAEAITVMKYPEAFGTALPRLATASPTLLMSP